ncbi:MAG: hypothetical protein IJK28_11695 [Clostridia bacterium]|nr:hypothetical protein [Clostridia bacterium]
MRKGGENRKTPIRLNRRLMRPFIYMTFTRFLLALAAGLLIDFFLGPVVHRDLKEGVFLIFGFLFALLALIAWMRLDGMKLPRLMMMRINPRKKPSRMYGDMADFLDEEPMTTFEDLEDGEKDVCILYADLVCCILFFAAAVIVML